VEGNFEMRKLIAVETGQLAQDEPGVKELTIALIGFLALLSAL
jgi:hypothetical protein